MVDTSTDSIHNKTHSLFGCLKTVFGGRSRGKGTRFTAPKPNAPNVTADPDAKSDPVNPKNDISKTDDHDAKDYWQIAYDELTESDRNTLTLLLATATKPQDAGRSRTKEILDKVINATETQYKEKLRKDGIRATAHQILNSALSFQDVVSNTMKFDPTGYASSAWAIVSLGLTMAKNHADLQDALFDSSGYLADLLTRCAFIEEQFYGGSGPVTGNAEKEQSIIRVYVAILQYSAEVHRAQRPGKGKDIVESITAVTSQKLAELKTSIKEEEFHLHHWLALDQHLRRQAEAEAILTHIDKLTMEIRRISDKDTIQNLPSADDALFDSYKDQHEAKCLAGTRTDLLRQVKDWGRSSDIHIFWLSGMAGTGKSTIARTVAQSFKEDGILGASFFFKRGEKDRSSAAKFFPTIVKQLTVHVPQMITGIQKAIEDDPAIPGKSLRDQFDKLMLKPLRAVTQDSAMASTVIVIDALDECEPEKDIEVILELLPKVEKATHMAIRFFLTSRPESRIRFGFDQINHSDYQNTILQDLDVNMTKHDITIFLREEFSKIRRDWPGEQKIDDLATMAVPLFIVAATVCRFVADPRFDPEERLGQFSKDLPGTKMDKTYQPILNQLLTKDESDTDMLVNHFQNTIGVIILLAAPLSLNSLAELLGMSEGSISRQLNLFYSVLTVPKDPNLPVRPLHLSFHDYLVDEHRKKKGSTSRFWVDEREKHNFIAGQCLIVMGRYLRKNICKLPTYGTRQTEIDPAAIASSLPPTLQYACRYWVYHLNQSSAPAINLNQVLPFLEEHFLHWLESMSIIGPISESLNAVDTLLKLMKGTSHNAATLFLSDARRFILKFANIVDTAPLQLYSSGLIFAPQKALIRRNFEKELPDWLSRGPRVEESWNGQLLASASADETIKLWDPTTGALKHTISTDSIIANIEFSTQLPQLITNAGSFDIQVCYESLMSNPSEKVAQVSLADRWITIQGQRELWLPPDYLPSSLTAKDGTIVLGCTNGRVVIIMFSTT
ncbi:hypothetical protein BJX76DRAFT_348278 [Aspergillus varians]